MPRPPAPPDPAKLLDAALDVFVYAPIGFLLDAREVVPKLAERGKGQVALARLFGRFAVQRGQAEADRILRLRTAPTRPVVEDAGAPPASAATTATTAARSTARSAPRSAASGATTSATKAAAAKRKAKAPAKRKPVAASGLAIPGYDTLSASQVVPRLDALRAAELEAVRAYEAAHRGRRTILNRIAQLQA
jgi:hypothetical protein